MKIPLSIHEPLGLARENLVLTGGVPVAQGSLREGGDFTLTRAADGRAFATEGRPAAWWPDGSVKWLHLCGRVDLPGGPNTPFTLTPVATTAQPADSGLQHEIQGDQLRIRGGRIDVDLQASKEALLSATLGGEALFRGPGLSARLEYVGPDGDNRRGFDWMPAEAPPQIVFESRNRIVARLAGAFRDAEGQAVSELILFVEMLREAPQIRLQPVWIYLGRAQHDLVASLTVTAHLVVDPADARYTTSMDRGPGFTQHIQPVRHVERGTGMGPRWPMVRQTQLGSSYFVTEKRTFKQDAAWLKCMEGQRAQGWIGWDDGRFQTVAAMRYFWQEAPRSLALDIDEGRIAFGLVPADARPLDLRRYSPLRYGDAVYEYGEGPYDWDLHGPAGIAKASELMLDFSPSDRGDMAECALGFCRPARISAAPSYLAESRVLGEMTAAQPVRHAKAEAEIDRIVDLILSEQAYRGWYGLMDFGDIMSSYYSDTDRWAFDDGGYAWINTESLPDYGLWISALRSGRPDALEAAIAMSRHNRDVDCYHRGQLRGTGSRHNVNHWGCADKEWRVSMPLARRLLYYVTADPWSLEVMRNTLDVYRSYERTAAVAPALTSALAGLLAGWEQTGDPELEAVCRNMADLYARAVRPDGQFVAKLHVDLATGVGHPVGDEPHASTFFMNTFGGQHALIDLAERLDHAPLRDALVRHAAYWLDSGKAGLAVAPFLAFAARNGGGERCRAALREMLDKLSLDLETVGGDGPLDVPRHDVLKGWKRINKVACHALGDTLHCTPYALAAL